MGLTLETLLKQRAAEQPDKPAAIANGHQLSYLELEAASNRLANMLLRQGIKRGDLVASLLPLSSLDSLICYFGATKTGGIAAQLDGRLDPEPLNHVLQDCQPKAVITQEPLTQKLALAECSSIEHVIELDANSTMAEILKQSSPESPGIVLNGEDTASIRFTSGTTGRSKGNMFTHQALVAGAQITVQLYGMNSREVFVCDYGLPPSWAIHVVYGPTLAAGATGAISAKPSLTNLLEVISKYRGAIIFAMPYSYSQTVDLPENELRRYELSSLRLCLSVGGALTARVLRRFREIFGLNITLAYSTSESAQLFAIQPLDGSGKQGSVGKVALDCELKIVNEEGKELPPGQYGEVIVKGPAIFHGYLNKPQLTSEVLRDGWFYTDDIGRLDESGYLFLAGRKRDTITVAGQAIYPGDIEEVLYDHPKVKEVAVVGIPDQQKGEILRAVIVPKQGEEVTPKEIRDFCRGRLREVEIPAEIRFIGSLPRTPTGKVRRETLRE